MNCRSRFLLRGLTRTETDEKEIMKNIKFVVSVVISSPLVYLLLCLYTEPPGPVSVVESWPHGIRFAKWRDHDLPTNRWLDWDRIGQGLGLDRGNLSLILLLYIRDYTFQTATPWTSGLRLETPASNWPGSFRWAPWWPSRWGRPWRC